MTGICLKRTDFSGSFLDQSEPWPVANEKDHPFCFPNHNYRPAFDSIKYINDSMKRWDERKKEEALSIEKWDRYFLRLAEFVSQNSKDPSTKVGAVITDSNRRVISVGYNGYPQKIKDTPERLNNRDIKYESVVHAEVNAVLFARGSVAGYTLYTWPFGCCSRCSSIMIQAGISRVVFPKCDQERWLKSIGLAKEYFLEAGVEVVEYGV
jgi:dCMP deaminase